MQKYIKKLTIGMATYDDFHGVYFTIQSLRMYHQITKTEEVEFIVIDNNPSGSHGESTKNLTAWIPNLKYIPFTEKNSTSIRNEIFKNAEGQYTICMDPHVLIQPNGINNLLSYYEKNPDCKNIVQGAMIYDDLKSYATSFNPKWRNQMYGTWYTDKESYEKGEPFSIPMMGLGTFSCETKNWLGFNEAFKGFGGEEWYIHEKFRQNGGDAICLPGFEWLHRFGRPDGVKYPLKTEDRIWNYLIGWIELYKDIDHEMIKSIENHFIEVGFNQSIIQKVKEEAIEYHKNKKTIL